MLVARIEGSAEYCTETLASGDPDNSAEDGLTGNWAALDTGVAANIHPMIQAGGHYLTKSYHQDSVFVSNDW